MHKMLVLCLSMLHVWLIPVVVLISWTVDAMLQVGLTKTPVWTRKEVRTLTEDRTSSIARIRADLGYEPM